MNEEMVMSIGAEAIKTTTGTYPADAAAMVAAGNLKSTPKYLGAATGPSYAYSSTTGKVTPNAACTV